MLLVGAADVSVLLSDVVSDLCLLRLSNVDLRVGPLPFPEAGSVELGGKWAGISSVGDSQCGSDDSVFLCRVIHDRPEDLVCTLIGSVSLASKVPDERDQFLYKEQI
jgi:hypothetical protein